MRLALASLASASVLAAASAAHGQLFLNEIGGTLTPDNYATQPGATAFAKDLLPGFPAHSIPHLNDATYGNSNSWIGNSAGTFAGVSFGANALPLGRVAWGRDNLQQFGDRTAGTYTLEYTTDPNPNEFTANWTPIGSRTYVHGGAPGALNNLSSRHVWSFAPVNATGVRLFVPGADFGTFAAIDELEAYNFAPPGLILKEQGGTQRPDNLAPAGMPFAKDVILNPGNGQPFPEHSVPHLNDGAYGNANSWIGNSAGSFAGIAFAGGAETIASIAFGRDNTGQFVDRAAGDYVLQYTNDPNPDAGTPDSSWVTIAPRHNDPELGDRAQRHEYMFAPVTATGVRVIVPGVDFGTFAAIDELEVYAVPEPGGLALAGLAAAALAARRRRR